MIQLSAKCTTGILTYILFTNKGEQIIVELTDLLPQFQFISVYLFIITKIT